MRQTLLFTRAKREAPREEISRNARLLVQAGFVNKEMAGVYSFLPLGLRVLRKIENIIREEMITAGGQEVLMPALHPRENWERTGRWETMDDLYKVRDKSDREFALGPTHEEIVVPILKQFVSSYKDLPKAVFQIQDKFRMELRAKSGLLRGREFIMKDMYSFHATEEDLKNFYEKMAEVYKKIFDRVGIGHLTYMTFAAGGTFSKYSHEFQTVTPAGEDTIYADEKRGIAVNKEVLNDEVLASIGLKRKNLVEKKSIEVGNIFELKTKYSGAFDYKFKDASGKEHTVLMGCYGIGLPRLMGTVAEVFADEKGLVWPKNIAPFAVHLVPLQKEVLKEAEKMYNNLTKVGVEVLFDDRIASAGEKLVESDLLGIPVRFVVSERNKGKIEVKIRTEEKTKLETKVAALSFIKKYVR